MVEIQLKFHRIFVLGHRHIRRGNERGSRTFALVYLIMEEQKLVEVDLVDLPEALDVALTLGKGMYC